MIKIKGLDNLEDKKLEIFYFNTKLNTSLFYHLNGEKNTIAIWDNRSILHQATPFSGNRIMHRITIQ